jgi:hypothetical protein
MKFADRWLGLIAAIVCVAMTVMIATAPLVVNPNASIPDDLAMWARHWVEGGLMAFAVLFLFLHYATNRKPKK